MGFRIEDITYVADVDGKKALAESRLLGLSIGRNLRAGVDNGTRGIDTSFGTRMRASFSKIKSGIKEAFSESNLRRMDRFKDGFNGFLQTIGDRASFKGMDSTVRLVIGLIASFGPAIAVLSAATSAGLVSIADGVGAFILQAGGAALLIKGLTADASKLSPAAQDAKKSMKGFTDSLKELPSRLASAAGPQLLGLFQNLNQLLKNVEPALTRFTTNVAGALQKLSGNLISGSWPDRLSGLFDAASKLLDPLNQLILDSLASLIDLFTVTAEPAAKFLGALDKIVKRFDDFISSDDGRKSVEDWFKNASKIAPSVADLIGKISDALSRLTTPAALKDTEVILKFIGDLADPISRVLDLLGGGVAAGMKEFMDSIDPSTVKSFKELLNALKPVGKDIGRDVGRALADLANALRPVMKQLTDYAKKDPKGFAHTVELIALAVAALAAAPSLASTTSGFLGLANAFSKLAPLLAVIGPGLSAVAGAQQQGALQKQLDKSRTNPDTSGIADFGKPLKDGLKAAMLLLPQVVTDGMPAIGTALFNGLTGIAVNIPTAMSGIQAGFSLGLQALPGLAIGPLASVTTLFSSTFFGLAIPVTSGVAAARTAVQIGLSSLAGVVTGALAPVGAVWNSFWSGLGGRVGSLLGGIAAQVRSAVNAAISVINLGISGANAALGGIGVRLPQIPRTAVGGLFNSAQARIIGEAGPEAVVPLRRPLSQVDPSVRALSAYAQGKTVTNDNKRSVTFADGAFRIQTAVQSPRILTAILRDAVEAAIPA